MHKSDASVLSSKGKTRMKTFWSKLASLITLLTLCALSLPARTAPAVVWAQNEANFDAGSAAAQQQEGFHLPSLDVVVDESSSMSQNDCDPHSIRYRIPYFLIFNLYAQLQQEGLLTGVGTQPNVSLTYLGSKDPNVKLETYLPVAADELLSIGRNGRWGLRDRISNGGASDQTHLSDYFQQFDAKYTRGDTPKTLLVVTDGDMRDQRPIEPGGIVDGLTRQGAYDEMVKVGDQLQAIKSNEIYDKVYIYLLCPSRLDSIQVAWWKGIDALGYARVFGLDPLQEVQAEESIEDSDDFENILKESTLSNLHALITDLLGKDSASRQDDRSTWQWDLKLRGDKSGDEKKVSLSGLPWSTSGVKWIVLPALSPDIKLSAYAGPTGKSLDAEIFTDPGKLSVKKGYRAEEPILPYAGKCSPYALSLDLTNEDPGIYFILWSAERYHLNLQVLQSPVSVLINQENDENPPPATVRAEITSPDLGPLDWDALSACYQPFLKFNNQGVKIFPDRRTGIDKIDPAKVGITWNIAELPFPSIPSNYQEQYVFDVGIQGYQGVEEVKTFGALRPIYQPVLNRAVFQEKSIIQPEIFFRENPPLYRYTIEIPLKHFSNVYYPPEIAVTKGNIPSLQFAGNGCPHTKIIQSGGMRDSNGMAEYEADLIDSTVTIRVYVYGAINNLGTPTPGGRVEKCEKITLLWDNWPASAPNRPKNISFDLTWEPSGLKPFTLELKPIQ